MGKVRIRKEVKKKGVVKDGARDNEALLKKTVGKLESEIEAISLGPPRSKILKKTTPSANSGQIASNFASRINLLNKQKKKVRFCQNLVAEELKEQKTSSEDAKHYFKVIHPSAIEKRIRASGGAKVQTGQGQTPAKTKNFIESIISDPEVIMSTSARALRKIIKNSTRNKKTVLKAKKQSFHKKIQLLKAEKEESEKAKQRQQTVIVGDMLPILQSLPDLTQEDDADVASQKDEKPKVVPIKTKYSMKKTQQAILDSLKFFEASGVSVGVDMPTT